MAIAALKKVGKLNSDGERAMSAMPVSLSVQEEIDAGNLIARPVKCGPLGLRTGEVFLELTDAGRSKLSDA